MTRGWIAGVIAATLGLAAPAAAEDSIVLPRPGHVGFGAGGGYGTLLADGSLGGTYADGGTLLFRLRYRMRYERALGLAFESQRFAARERRPLLDPFAPSPDRLQAVLAGAEFYQLFGTRTRTTRMLHVGVGVAQTAVRLNDGQDEFPGDATFVSIGAGVEQFVFRSWAWELNARYLALFHSGEVNHNLQVTLGVIGYASY